MAGFFKKLFNRIIGKPSDEAKPLEAEQAALPAPEPAPEPAVKVVAPKVQAKKPEAKKPEPKKPEPKKIEKAKPVAKAPVKAPVKPAPKAKGKIAEPTPKKIETKKPATKVPPAKKPETKKPEPKKIVPEKKAAPTPAKKAKIEIEKPAQVPVPPPPPPPSIEVVEEVIVAPPPPPQKTARVPAPVVETPARGGWFSRLKEGLSKSSKTITGSITAIFTKRKLDKETLQELEDTLIQADLGIAVAERIIAAVSHGRYDKEVDPEDVKKILAAEVAKVLKPVEVPFNFGAEKPYVILVVGVNGSGKTTTIGKLGSIAASEDFKVMFAACDTFRAAAVEQLTVWGERVGATTMSAPIGADAAGLAFDALKQAREDGTDILFIDTAGRLQNKAYLMDELDKVVRVIKKMDPAAPHAVLLVLDATTGQNALAQAEIFTKVAGVTGLIMTKLDGTARGGILVAIAEKFKLPIHAIGVGETIEDLQPFDAEAFSRAIAGFED
jgi:fused signal recognition particle receptor